MAWIAADSSSTDGARSRADVWPATTKRLLHLTCMPLALATGDELFEPECLPLRTNSHGPRVQEATCLELTEVVDSRVSWI
jgi:hypothetical protein